MAIITRRCRDLATGAGVMIALDTTTRTLEGIRVVTTTRPVTITFLTDQGGVRHEVVVPPGSDVTRDLRARDIPVRTITITKADGTDKQYPGLPFQVAF